MVEVVHGDLLGQNVDVIVNSWNRNFIPWWLLIPQGVSGAIKRGAGFQPFRELARKGTLKAGEAVITSPGRLNYKAIIHVAALNCFWLSSESIVQKCTSNALAIAAEHGFDSIAMPLFGAGTGGLDPSRCLSVIQAACKGSHYRGLIRIIIYTPAIE